ncbi:hypothetical protein [Marivirga sericea]|nr:hypothetical protein [Marivirga sericea]
MDQLDVCGFKEENMMINNMDARVMNFDQGQSFYILKSKEKK